MPPPLALALAFVCALVLMKFDSARPRQAVSSAVWIPTLWLLIIGSRPISYWFGLNRSGALLEGSPVDRNIFSALIIFGAGILVRRRVNILDFGRQNRWLILFVAYGGISILWSDFGGIAFKRWLKLVGNIVMGAIIATELNSTEAFRTVLARCGYILLPLSVVLIKYFPEYGRRYNPFSGEMQLTGVTTHKNELGTLCMAIAFFLVWSWTATRAAATSETLAAARARLLAYGVCGGMALWLLVQANSGTSNVTAMLGVAILLLLHRSRGSRMRMVTPVVLGSLGVLAILYCSGLVEMLILAIGEDVTLTGRTELWTDVIAAGTNSVVGDGFESFWVGSVAAVLWQKYWWHPVQAHNGFLETYLNLGISGLILLICYIAHVYSNSLAQMRSSEFDRGRFTLAFLVIVVLYNITEAAFHGLSLVWVMQLLSGVKYVSAFTSSGSNAVPYPCADYLRRPPQTALMQSGGSQMHRLCSHYMTRL